MTTNTTSLSLPPRLRPWVLPLALLALWAAAGRTGLAQSPLWVSPLAVWQTALEQVGSGALVAALAASLQRDLLGLAIGVPAGLLFGALLGASRWARRLVGPSFHTVKQVSLFAWIPMLSMWFGAGEGAKVAFIALAAFFPVALNTIEGVQGVPRDLVEVARVLRFSRWQLATRLVAPAAAPSIFTGVQLALIYTWLATLGAEYLLASGAGIGNTLVDGRERFEMQLVVFGMVVVGLVGSALQAATGLAERRLLTWREHTVARY